MLFFGLLTQQVFKHMHATAGHAHGSCAGETRSNALLYTSSHGHSAQVGQVVPQSRAVPAAPGQEHFFFSEHRRDRKD